MIDHRYNGKCVNVPRDTAIGLGNEPLDIGITFPVISGNLINNARYVRSVPYEKQTRLRAGAPNSWTGRQPRRGCCAFGISPARNCMSRDLIGIARARIYRERLVLLCARS